MEYTEVEDRVKDAIKRFEAENLSLLEVEANERSLTHKLAECLQLEFSGWNVDCEYNRKGFEIKKLNLNPVPILSDDDMGTTVYPDIIVHHRLIQEDNLLVIEAKKVEGDRDKGENDRKKLKAFLSELGYKFAIFVKFRINHIMRVDYERVSID